MSPGPRVQLPFFMPEPSFKLAGIYNGEVFMRDDDILARMLQQSNPVYLVLELPGHQTSISICFPTPRITRIYRVDMANREDVSQGGTLVCEVEDGANFYDTPMLVGYHFGMKFPPWGFSHLLGVKHNDKKDYTVNYIVLNSLMRHSGVLIRLLRKSDTMYNPIRRHDEWLELWSISTGNNYKFFERWRSDPNTKLMARFVPKGDGRPNLVWEPEIVMDVSRV